MKADSGRVLRGGSWGYGARFVRAVYRLGYDPAYRLDDTGFRLVRTVVAPALVKGEKHGK